MLKKKEGNIERWQNSEVEEEDNEVEEEYNRIESFIFSSNTDRHCTYWYKLQIKKQNNI